MTDAKALLVCESSHERGHVCDHRVSLTQQDCQCNNVRLEHEPGYHVSGGDRNLHLSSKRLEIREIHGSGAQCQVVATTGSSKRGKAGFLIFRGCTILDDHNKRVDSIQEILHVGARKA